MKKTIWIGIIIIVLVVIAIAVSSDKKAVGETVKIGAAVPLTGDASVWGEAAINGIKLAVNEINQKGGIAGKQIDLLTEDSRSSSKDTVSAVSKLQNIDGAQALLVSWLDVYQGAESVLKPNTLMISPDAGIEGVNGIKMHENVFSTWYRTQPKSELAIKHIANRGKKKLYIVAQNDSYYITAVNFMEEAAKKYGVEIVGKDMLSEGTDMQTILTKIKASKADVVFVALYDEKENVDFLKKHKALLGSAVDVYGDEFVQQNYANPSFRADWFEGFYFYGPKEPNISFVQAYKTKYGKDPVFGAGPAYDAVYMIAKAVKDNPKDLNSYMRQTQFDTVSYGKATFDVLGGVTTPENYFVMKQIKNGSPINAQ